MSFGGGVGDAIQLAHLAQELIHSYTDAPREFLEVSNYAQSLCLVLEELGNSVQGIDLGASLTTRLQSVTANSQTLLEGFNGLVKKHASLISSKNQKLLDSMRWPSKQIVSLRIRLSTQTGQLLLIRQDTSGLKQSGSEAKLHGRINDIAQQLCERRPPNILTANPKSVDELVETFMPDWHPLERVWEEASYHVYDPELVEAFVTCQWPQHSPITIQVAGSDTCSQLLEVLESLSLSMDFNIAFLGNRGLRKHLINAMCQRLPECRDRAFIIDTANAVMKLMFLIFHKRNLYFDGHLKDTFGRNQLVPFLRSRLRCVLARTLMIALHQVMWQLEHLMKKGRQEDWPLVFVSMCFVLFGVECMAVNVHILEPGYAPRLDDKIEIEGVQVLLNRFKAYTNRGNPLELDWSMPRNKELVQMDETTLAFSKSLQEVTSQHCRFLQHCRTASYDQANDNSYIGKFVSVLMV